MGTRQNYLSVHVYVHMRASCYHAHAPDPLTHGRIEVMAHQPNHSLHRCDTYLNARALFLVGLRSCALASASPAAATTGAGASASAAAAATAANDAAWHVYLHRPLPSCAAFPVTGQAGAQPQADPPNDTVGLLSATWAAALGGQLVADAEMSRRQQYGGRPYGDMDTLAWARLVLGANWDPRRAGAGDQVRVCGGVNVEPIP